MRKRGEIWLADLNPPPGTEAGRNRPVLIVQTQTLLDVQYPSTLVIPFTTNLIEDAAPLRILVPGSCDVARDSDLLVDQHRAIDHRRLARGPLAQLTLELMSQVNAAIRDILEVD